MKNTITYSKVLMYFIVYTLLLSTQTVIADALPAYQINDHIQSDFIGANTEYLEDKNGELTLREILAIENQSTSQKNIPKNEALVWRTAPEKGITKGFTPSIYWLRFSTENTTQHTIKWYLEFAYPLLDVIEFYTPGKQGNYLKKLTGDHLPFTHREIQYRNIILPVTSEADSYNTYYIRIQSTSSMNVPLKAWSKNTVYSEINDIKMFLGIMYGIISLALVSALVNAVFLKDIKYFWLSFAFVGITLYLSGVQGINFQYFWPNSIWWATFSVPLFVNLGYIPVLQYCRLFIDIKKYWPRLDKAFIAIIFMGCIAVCLSLILPYSVMIRFCTISVSLQGILCIIAGILSWAKGNTSARLYVIAWSIFLVSSIAYAFTALGVLPRTLITTWSQEVGFLFFVTLMTIAQLDHFLQKQKQHEEEQAVSLAELTKTEKKYRSLFENAIEGIFQMDQEGFITNANKTFTEIIEIGDFKKIIEVETTPFTLCFLENSEAQRLGETIKAKGSISDYQATFANFENTVCWVSISIQKTGNQAGDGFSYEGSITDITESKKRAHAEKQSRMSEASTEAKSLFLANMSHEIRTPINAIIGLTELATTQNEDHEIEGFLNKTNMASSNLLGIINDILDFSQMETGQLVIDSVPFNVSDLIQILKNSVTTNVKAKGLKFHISVDPDLPNKLIGDPQRIRQILTNLTNNAIKFTDTGEVRLEFLLNELHKKVGKVSLTGRVIDTGIGISEEQQETLFSSFINTMADDQKSNQTEKTGTGIGLSISKQLIEMMGGELKVASTLGKGSCFEFNIACRIESRKRREGEEPELENNRAKKI